MRKPQLEMFASKSRLHPGTAVTGGATIGAPLAVVLVWLANTHWLAEPMPSEIATAAGAVITALVGYVAELVHAFIDRVRELRCLRNRT